MIIFLLIDSVRFLNYYKNQHKFRILNNVSASDDDGGDGDGDQGIPEKTEAVYQKFVDDDKKEKKKSKNVSIEM